MALGTSFHTLGEHPGREIHGSFHTPGEDLQILNSSKELEKSGRWSEAQTERVGT